LVGFIYKAVDSGRQRSAADSTRQSCVPTPPGLGFSQYNGSWIDKTLLAAKKTGLEMESDKDVYALDVWYCTFA
jgi:hypothetical protein